jgi:hypothetical protein
LPGDASMKIGLTARAQVGIQLLETLHARHRHEVAAAKAPDLTLDAALFMGTVDADDREL